MGQKLFEDKIGALSHNAGIISMAPSKLTIGGQQYVTTTTLQYALPALTANTLYMIYAVQSGGVVSLVQSVNVNSMGPVGYSSWKLVGAYYANGGPPNMISTTPSAIAFGSFVTIQGAPTSEWIPSNQVILATTTPPSKPAGRINDEYRWKRSGDTMFIYYSYHHNAGGGSGGSGIYLFELPTNTSINANKTPPGQDGNPRNSVGPAFADSGGGGNTGFVKVWDTTVLELVISANGSAVATQVGSGNFSLATAAMAYAYEAEVAITGWSITPLKDL